MESFLSLIVSYHNQTFCVNLKTGIIYNTPLPIF